MSKKICVLASGGDCPAMNACVEAVYLSAKQQGLDVYAASDGFDGLIDADIVPLTMQNAIGISGISGCVFKCGRSKRFMDKEGFLAAVETVKKYEFAAVVVIGGNGSLIGAGRLKNAGLPILFVPATIDNDVDYTEHSLGFSSACESSVKLIDALKATMQTSRRDFVVQIMGRHCNKLTTRIGIASFADVVDMEGQRYTAQQIADIFVRNRKMGKESNFVLTQERKAPDHIQEMLESTSFVKQLIDATGDSGIRLTTLGYLQRGAEPSSYDRFLASLYGKAVMDCFADNKLGLCVSAVNDKVVLVDMPLYPMF